MRHTFYILLQVFVERAHFLLCPFNPVCRPKLTKVLPFKKNRALLLSLLAQNYHCRILLAKNDNL